MLISFFLHLRGFRIPVSIREFLDLNASMKSNLVFADTQAFYYLSRLILVKDEKYYDRFDRAFESFFTAVDQIDDLFQKALIEETLIKLFEMKLSLEEKEVSENLLAEMRNWIAEYRKHVEENTEKHLLEQNRMEKRSITPTQRQGDEFSSAETREDVRRSDAATEEGSDEQGIGEGSGEGNGQGEGENGKGEGNNGEEGNGEEGDKGEGLNGIDGVGAGEIPGQGIKDRDAQPQSSAIKVWQQRLFEDYDEEVELGTRNIKIALRRLRKFARTSLEEELDLEDTIKRTAKNAGLLDIRMVPEKKNTVKVLLFLDVGGSMDSHVETCAQLFSAAKYEFKYLEFFYFHNFVYESVWTNNERRQEDRVSLLEITRTYASDYKVIFVGDAQMGRHEITERGGSVEHFNAEAGQIWMRRLTDHFRRVVWINPVSRNRWMDSPSLQLTNRLMDQQMYHLSVEGLSEAMAYLAR